MMAAQLRQESTYNPDLMWDLSHLANSQLASDFFLQISHSFCIYSPASHKLYSHFNVESVDDGGRLMIEPTPCAYDNTYQFITPNSIKNTGIILYSGKYLHRNGYYLGIPIHKDECLKHFSLTKGIEFLNQTFMENTGAPFLPIILKGDLQAFKTTAPYLHLHRADIASMQELSALDRGDLFNTILDRFSLIIHADKAQH
ncbi:hypothetical protein [Spartinivicinus poritis]|uniref:AraC family transcriptional regulator n=1 Tax=Spartinivicinus poritis TaxID=2994640 RepID=A0ABT5UER7_9GAMM|nr:hypothetical protein [Spartinivicinus sp. A2-2]MDE1464883.1 hypothetical protein [Spartinivicinus sp. A2-2]